MPTDDPESSLTPTPQLSPAELADLALRLALRLPAARDANVAELVKILEQLRAHPSVDRSTSREAGGG
jgi:hypothetical protein